MAPITPSGGFSVETLTEVYSKLAHNYQKRKQICHMAKSMLGYELV